MKKFACKIVSVKRPVGGSLENEFDRQREDRLNEFGAEGWELVTISVSMFSDTHIFKREISEGTE